LTVGVPGDANAGWLWALAPGSFVAFFDRQLQLACYTNMG